MYCSFCKEDINLKGQDNISPISSFPVCEDCVDKMKCDESKRPDCKLIGENGNIFNLLAIASKTLRDNGMSTQAQMMYRRVTSSESYDKALCIIGEYVNII